SGRCITISQGSIGQVTQSAPTARFPIGFIAVNQYRRIGRSQYRTRWTKNGDMRPTMAGMNHIAEQHRDIVNGRTLAPSKQAITAAQTIIRLPVHTHKVLVGERVEAGLSGF